MNLRKLPARKKDSYQSVHYLRWIDAYTLIVSVGFGSRESKAVPELHRFDGIPMIGNNVI